MIELSDGPYVPFYKASCLDKEPSGSNFLYLYPTSALGVNFMLGAAVSKMLTPKIDGCPDKIVLIDFFNVESAEPLKCLPNAEVIALKEIRNHKNLTRDLTIINVFDFAFSYSPTEIDQSIRHLITLLRLLPEKNTEIIISEIECLPLNLIEYILCEHKGHSLSRTSCDLWLRKNEVSHLFKAITNAYTHALRDGYPEQFLPERGERLYLGFERLIAKSE